jgi:hypothetical protein
VTPPAAIRIDQGGKNKHPAGSQGVRGFGKRSKFLIYVSISNGRTTPDHGLRRRFSTLGYRLMPR